MMTNAEIKYLLEQYLEETISEEEFRRLFECFADERFREQWNDVWEEMLNNPRLGGLSDEPGREAALSRINSIVFGADDHTLVQETEAPVRRIISTRFVKWVAAASVLLIAGMVIWNRDAQKPEQVAVKEKTSVGTVANDVVPGGNKAVLTLADGSIIRLDDAGDGTLGTQGATQIVKLADGRLAYRPGENAQPANLMNTLTTPRGGQYELTLPDGTQVWLNAASSISYPVQFTGRERKIRMTGEVYFEVAHNDHKPFIVDVDGKSSITVLGTHFNVNSYADEGAVSTTLLEGKVRIASARGESAVLRPGQQAKQPIAPGGKMTLVSDADIDEVMAWKNGTFYFNRTSLPVVMRQIERWYDVEVIYEKQVPSIRFGGEIKRDLTLSQLLEGLQEMGVRCEIRGKKLHVKS